MYEYAIDQTDTFPKCKSIIVDCIFIHIGLLQNISKSAKKFFINKSKSILLKVLLFFFLLTLLI